MSILGGSAKVCVLVTLECVNCVLLTEEVIKNCLDLDKLKIIAVHAQTFKTGKL